MRKEILKVIFIILCVMSTKIQSSAKKVGGKPDRLGLDCCPTVRVSSSSLGTQFQSAKMGLYKAMKGKLNNRRVYKHTQGNHYLYYWAWGKNQGENWMLGNSFRSSVHGIESENMQHSNHAWCPSDINILRFPFRVHTSGGTWLKDTMMRIECVDMERPCCRRVRLVSRGLAATYQPARLGIYTATALRNYRYFYTKDEGAGYIYYWDWGPNSGANWLISSNSDGTNRGIESDNVETGATNYTMCLNEARRAGDFRVYNGEKQEWDFDGTLRILCLDDKQVGGPSLSENGQNSTTGGQQTSEEN